LYYAAKCLLAVQNSAGKFNQNPQKSNISESTTQNIPTKRICASFAKKYQRILAIQVLTTSSLMCQLTEPIDV